MGQRNSEGEGWFEQEGRGTESMRLRKEGERKGSKDGHVWERKKRKNGVEEEEDIRRARKR